MKTEAKGSPVKWENIEAMLSRTLKLFVISCHVLPEVNTGWKE